MALLKNSFQSNSLILCDNYEANPLFWFDFSINLFMIIALLEDGQAAGAEAQCAKSPQERLLVSLQDFP
jgi:hypothetical protein